LASSERIAGGKVPSPGYEPINFSPILLVITAHRPFNPRWALNESWRMMGFGTQPDIRELPDASVVVP
jgi:hypothetical protein